MIEPQADDLAGAVLYGDNEVFVGLQLRHEIDRRVLPPIDLALLQRRSRSARVGHEVPHDPVDIDDLGSGVEARLAILARYVIRVLLEHDALAGHALRSDEFERAAADRLLDLLVGIGLRQPLRHNRAIHLRERVGQQRKRLFQADADDLVGTRADLVGARYQRRAHRVTLAKALDRRHAIAGQDWRTIVEFEPVAQRQVPFFAIVGDAIAGDHLRLHLELGVEAVKRIVDCEREVPGDVGGGPDRVERGEVGMRNEVDRGLSLSPDDLRRGQRGGPGEDGFEHIASLHVDFSRTFRCRTADAIRRKRLLSGKGASVIGLFLIPWRFSSVSEFF